MHQRVLLTNTALIDETKPASETCPVSDVQSEQLDAALNQLLQIANEMQVNGSRQSVDSPWGVSSAVNVQIDRRDTDSKGYVAVRLDRSTGITWWLNDRTWQAY